MAGRKAGSPSRSDFIRKFLSSNPSGKLPDVNEAWKKSGQSGEITATLFYQVKSKSGHSKKRRGGRRRGRPPRAVAAATSSSAPAAGGSGYAMIERTLDQLVFAADKMKDTKLTELLRDARRHASAKLV